jgi:hypothetical protein
MDPPNRRPTALIAPGPSNSDQRRAPINPENRPVPKSAQAFVPSAQPPCTTILVTPAEQLNFDFGPTFPPQPAKLPKADLFVFPLARQRALIRKLAALVAGALTPEMGANLLRGRLARLGRGLHRKRVPEKIIADELSALEGEVHRELWRPRPGGRANG